MQTFLLLIFITLAPLAAFGANYPEGKSASDSPWKGTHLIFEFGPSWRMSDIASRTEIPNTIGGQFGVSLRTALGKTFFFSVGSQLAITTQTEGHTNSTIGDWSGTEYHPLVPGIGLRFGSIHLLFAYPMFGKLVLLSKTANGDDVKYSTPSFIQGTLYFETTNGLFGFQYRKGTFKTESVGANSTTLDPAMNSSAFSILFGFPLF